MPKYFVAILPPAKISKEIVDFQKEIETKFGSINAQKAPPHITVIPPFDCELERLDDFAKSISTFLVDKAINDENVYLDSFQRFESRTLFVDVAKNESFERLCKELKMLFNQQRIMKQRIEKHYFVPHITIANKDIKKRDFKIAWTNFKKRTFQRSFWLEELVVLELVHGEWKVINKIKLTK